MIIRMIGENLRMMPFASFCWNLGKEERMRHNNNSNNNKNKINYNIMMLREGCKKNWGKKT